jgi:hypothetical protein
MRNLYFIVIGWLLLLAGPAAGQAVRWERTLGAAGRTGGLGICPAPDGGLVTTGFRNAGRSAVLADSSRGGTDACVVKYSPTGQLQWNRALGTATADNGWQVRPTPDGGYLLTLESAAGVSFDHSQPSRGQRDYWVLKLDGQGRTQWDRSFGTDSTDDITDAWPTADGGYQLIGYSNATVAKGDKSEPGRGNTDYWVIKLDAQGHKLWDRTYGGAGYEHAMQGQPTPDGGCVLMGTTDSPAGGDISQASPGGLGDADYWVVRLDAQGNKLWDRRYGGTAGDNGQACILTPDGGYLIGGFSESGQGGDKSQPSRGDTDYWVLKLDGQGYRQWDATLGSASSDFINKGLVALTGGGYVVVGSSAGGVSGDRSQASRGYNDCWAVKLSATGQVQWDAAYGGIYNEFVRMACPTPSGGFALIAYSDSPVSGERTSPLVGMGNHWTVQVAADGTVQWDRAFGGNADDLQQVLVQAADGTFWLAGQTNGGAGLDNDEADYLAMQHGWLVQTDSLGTTRQTRSMNSGRRFVVSSLDFGSSPALLVGGTTSVGFIASYYDHLHQDANYYLQKFSTSDAYAELGGAGNDYLGEARATPDQGAILGGTSHSGVSGQKTEPSRGRGDFWVVKLNRQFLKTWDRTYGGSGLDSLVSVRRTPDGGYLLAGSTTSPADGELTEPSRGGADYWLVKLSSTGSVQWQHRYGGPADDWLAAARPTPDGGYILLGTTFSGVGGELTEAPLGRRDLWVVKVSSTGAVQWQHRYGGSGNEYAATLEPDPDGGFIVGASTTSPADGQVSQPSRGGTDYWLLRLSAQGAVLWDQRLGGSGEDLLTCLTTTKGYGYALGGTSNSPTASGDHQQANKDGYDYWTLVLGARRVPAPSITTFAPAWGLPGTQITLTGSDFTGTSHVSFNGVAAPGFVVSKGGTTITVTLPAGATTGLVAVTANGTGTSGTAFVVPTELIVSTVRQVQGIYTNVTITGPATGGAGVATLTGSLMVLGRLWVQEGGALLTNCQLLNGPGDFELAAGSTLDVCAAQGLAPDGAIQLTGTRTYSDDATYRYTGSGTQATGRELPATVRALSVQNPQGLRLSQDVSLRQALHLLAGDLTRAGNTLTLLSGPTGTALVDNSGGNILPGPGLSQQQRWLAADAYAGAGYRHYASPVLDTPLSQLGTSGTAPVLTVAYNTSATPGAVVPFPTVFGYDQARLGVGAAGPGDFDKGWYVPAGFTLGQGLSVHLAAPALVTFSGNFTTQASVRVGLGRGPLAAAGWHLLGNPFPAPFDLSAPGAITTTNADAAAYVYTSSGPYSGSYQAWVNGVGGGPAVLAAGQAFFVRTTTSGQPSEFAFNQAGRITQFGAQPAFRRTAADARPLVRLALQAGAGPADAVYVYAEAPATAGFDARFDAQKLANPGNNSLFALAATGEALAVQGLPALLPATVVPLGLTLGAAATVTWSASSLNLPAGLSAWLLDADTGTRQELTAAASYAVAVAAGTTLGRFSLAFGPSGQPLATRSSSSAGLAVFPNPAHAAATLRLPAVAWPRTIRLLDVLGQVVRCQLLPTQATTASLELAGLPAGLYLVQCEASTCRLLVE